MEKNKREELEEKIRQLEDKLKGLEEEKGEVPGGTAGSILKELGGIIPGLKGLVKGLERSEAFRERLGAIDKEIEIRLRSQPLKRTEGGVPSFQSGFSRGTRPRIVPPTKGQAVPRVKREVVASKEPAVDVFDEETHLRILAELPGVEEKDIKVGLDEAQLVISTDTPTHKYYKEITLTRAKFVELTEDLRQKMVGPTRQALADAGLKPEDIDRLILVGGATRMPAVRELSMRILGKEPYKDIQPDEAVALGAAIQAGILSGQIQGKVLIDVTPLSLGIETQGSIFTKVIERNTPIPTSQGQIFTNATDNQTSMDIHVLQGERDMAVDNMTLDRFDLTGISAMPRGEARIEVAFDIDANGILHVSANDLYGDSSQKVRVSPRFYGLPEEEITRMIEEAVRSSEDDQKRRKEVEINIKADNMVRAARQTIDQADAMTNLGLVDEVERTILEVQTALASGDSTEIKSRTEALEKEVKVLYRQVKQKQEAYIGDKNPQHE